MEVNIKNNQSNYQRLSAITVISTSDQIFFISKEDIIGFLKIMVHLTSQVWLGICSGIFYPLCIPPRLNPWNIGIQ